MSGKRIFVTIPGEPYALKRHRSTKTGIQYDPKENRLWKAAAQDHYRQAMDGQEPFAGPVKLVVRAQFSMPRSRWLKRKPRAGGWRDKRPDLDNIVKAVKDAGTGILWFDDSQVCTLVADKRTGNQGDKPFVWVEVGPLH